MARTPGTVSVTFYISYTSTEIPIGFIIHNKGFWSTYHMPEYFALGVGSYNTSKSDGGININSDYSNTTTTSARFTATVYTELNDLNNIEIAPIFSSMITG